jgi:regulator of protease activity HflC (stomatin/prohibitin superfamily)
MMWLYTLGVIILLFILMGLKVIKEYERGILFTFGKYTRQMKAGLKFVIPVVQTFQRVDLRVKAVDVPDQEAMTKDNISTKINAVIYYKVSNAEKAILEVEHYMYAISQLAQTTMRNVVGEVELDDLLAKRDKVSAKIQTIVDQATDPWGIKVNAVDLKDIVLPQDMKRVIGKQAEAEREKRAVIIKAEGEVIASSNMAKAASIMSTASGALHLRTLQSLNDISSDKSNTIVFALPIEVLRAFEGLGSLAKKNKK